MKPTRKVVTKFELKLVENTEATFDPSQHKKAGDIFVDHRSDDVETVLKYAVGGTDASSFKVITGAALTAARSSSRPKARWTKRRRPPTQSR